jgi:integrase
MQDMPLLFALKKAWKRAEGPPRKKKVPVLLKDIEKIVLSSHSPRGSKLAVRQAMARFGFHTLARVKEICAIKWRNITKFATYVSIYLESSKSDPFGDGGAYLSISRGEWDRILTFLKHKKHDPHSRVFPETEAKFRAWMSLSWGNGVTGHSLRRGGAQYLFDKGTPLQAIMQKGRWRSSAWQRYIDVSSRIILL